VNNIITANSAFNGGGLHAVTTGDVVAGTLNLINNTITENTSSNSGGGIYIDGDLDSVLNIYNNIIRGNLCPVGGDITLLYDPLQGAESYGFSNNYSYISGNWTQSGKNINADPQFMAPANGDYHLQSTSPCIDKGSNQAPNLPDKDYDGEPRIFDGNQNNIAAVDIGADEYIGVPLKNLTIESSSGGSTNPAPGQYVFTQGSDVQITAIPEDHYRFHEWTGDVPAGKKQDNPLIITMGSDKSIKAHFARVVYPPSDVSGQKVMNRSLSQAEYINVLKWGANTNNQDLNIAKYRIYVIDGDSQTLLVELSANIFEYWHRGVTKDGIYQYAISSVDDNNEESDPTNITVQ
jgi:predicted outer membrane repeat protein